MDVFFNPQPIPKRTKDVSRIEDQKWLSPIWRKTNDQYNHLGIAEDSITKNRYIETFFHQTTDMYIKDKEVKATLGWGRLAQAPQSKRKLPCGQLPF